MKIEQALTYAKNNYNSLPEPLKMSYDFINKVTQNGADMESYKSSEAITNTIKLAVDKLNELASKSPAKKEKLPVAKAAKVAKAVPSNKKEITTTKIKSQKTKNVKPTAQNQVEALPDEIVIMKRYLAFHQKEKTRNQVMNLLDALQKSILKKKIRKTSPFASIVNDIQKRLIKGYTAMQNGKINSIEIKLDADFYNTVKTEVDKFEALTSVKLINRYINLDGEKQTKEKAQKLSKDIDKFLSIHSSDPYLVNLREISTYLEQYIKSKHSHLVVNDQALAGLPWVMIAQKAGQGIKAAANATGRAIKKTAQITRPYVEKAIAKTKQVSKAAYVAAKTPVNTPPQKKKALGSIEPIATPSEPVNPELIKKNPLNDMFISGSTAAKVKPGETFRLYGDLGKFMGDIEQNQLGITIEGDQGSGKTQLAFQIANGLLDLNKDGAMLCYEIPHDSVPMRKFADQYLNQVNREKILYNSDSSQGLEFIKKAAPHLDWLIIDSWPKLKISPKEFDNIRKQFPNCIFIVILQRLSSGDIRGGNDALYDAGINIECAKVDNTFVNNYAYTSKNRYGQSGLKYNIAKQQLID